MDGREFHASGRRTRNFVSRTFFNCGSSYRKLLEDLSLSRPGRSATDVIISDRYAELPPTRTMCMSMQSLKTMRNFIGSQCRIWRTGVMWSRVPVPAIKSGRRILDTLKWIDRRLHVEDLRGLSYSSQAWLSRRLTPSLR